MSTVALILALAAPQQLPEPFATPWYRGGPDIVDQPSGSDLSVPPGFEVTVFAEGFRNPRRIALAPNGDVFLVQSLAGTVRVLRDGDGDGVAEVQEIFAEELDRPFGIAFRGDHVYIGNTGGVVRFDYTTGQLRAAGPPEPVVDLPPRGSGMDQDTADRLGISLRATGGYNHWTRNLEFSADGSKMYVAVGSATNATPGDDPRRAAINEYNPDGSEHRVYASGLRNPVGMAFNPQTGVLWSAVQERDHLGDDLVPDFVTSIVDGGFYGWPYAYIGPNPEPILEGARPDLIAESIVPDVLLESHSAALGLAFYGGDAFPEEYRGDLFVALHGSINRSNLSGYSVARIPFEAGQPSGPPEDFLSGFIVSDDEVKAVWGRPVDVLVAEDGSLLITDDAGGRIFRVRYVG